MEELENKLKRNTNTIFQRNVFNSNANTEKLNKKNRKNCRQNLQDVYEKSTRTRTSFNNDPNDRSVLSVLSLNSSRRMLRSSAEKIQKTFSNVRTTIGSISQKFRTSTRRRQLLEEGPITPCVSPRTRSKQILGRTPTKLYSPFDIESPRNGRHKKETNKENNSCSTRIQKLKKLKTPQKKNLLSDYNSCYYR